MRSIFFALVVLIAPLISMAQTVAPDASQVRIQTPVAFQVVGITMQTYTGNIGGRLGATRACLAAYGLGARMCSNSEVQASVVLPDGFGQGAPGMYQGGTVAWVDSIDINTNCSNWRTEVFSGSIVDLNGDFMNNTTPGDTSPALCNNAYPVMCCAPMPIPVTLPEPSASLGLSTGVFALLALNAGRG